MKIDGYSFIIGLWPKRGRRWAKLTIYSFTIACLG